MHRLRLLLVLLVSLAVSVSLASAQGLPYPTKTPYQLKGLGASTRDKAPASMLHDGATGGVAFNFYWDTIEQTPHSSCVAGEFAYSGHCYKITADMDPWIAQLTANGIAVTAILSWSPPWASNNCQGALQCAPATTAVADFARFAAALASRYDGQHGFGRIADFIIYNEVNENAWFDIGCGPGEPLTPTCNHTTWFDQYAALYNAAYDSIKAQQAEAKVLVPVTSQFTGVDSNTTISVQTFLTQFAARVGARQWMTAIHPNDGTPGFSVESYGTITPGTIGQLAGWLRKTFPSTPSAWEIQSTEHGSITTPNTPTGETEQAQWICSAFRNFLGTPGMTSHIYTPMTPLATFDTLELLKCPATGSCEPGTYIAKASWATWYLANQAGTLNCGFEQLPYVKLVRYTHTTRGHWVTTRMPPSGFWEEGYWHILREPAAGTHLLYECLAPGNAGTTHSLVTTAAHCENLYPLGPLGYVYDAPAAGRVPIYRCSAPGTHFVSPAANCEGTTFEGLLGYAVP
jgi:hypothetical protein